MRHSRDHMAVYAPMRAGIDTFTMLADILGTLFSRLAGDALGA